MKFLFSLLVLMTTLPLKAITIGTYNIRNFDYDQRYQIHTNKVELTSMLKELKADVLSVEEINNTAAFEDFVAKKLPGYETELTRCGGEHGQHLGFIYNAETVDLLSFNEDLAISNPGGSGTCDSGSRPLAVGLFQIRATKQKFYGMTVHLKSGSQPESARKRMMQFQIIQNLIKELKDKTGVQDFYVAGDFNTTEYITRGQDFVVLGNFLKSLGMQNMVANAKCTAYWWGGTDDGIETPSILDHVLVTPGLVKKAPTLKITGHCQKVSCREVPIGQLGVSYESVSDHCPIAATIQ